MVVPALTLAQHASLTAEIAVSPQRAAATYQRYGCRSPPEREALDRAWRERLAQNPTEQREWQDRYCAYRVYWTEEARRKNR